MYNIFRAKIIIHFISNEQCVYLFTIKSKFWLVRISEAFQIRSAPKLFRAQGPISEPEMIIGAICMGKNHIPME